MTVKKRLMLGAAFAALELIPLTRDACDVEFLSEQDYADLDCVGDIDPECNDEVEIEGMIIIGLGDMSIEFNSNHLELDDEDYDIELDPKHYRWKK